MGQIVPPKRLLQPAPPQRLAQQADHLARRKVIWEELLAGANCAAKPPVARLVSLAQQADHLARRKVIWETLQTSGTICSTKKAFAASTAATTGATKQDINRQVARANALGSDIRAVVGTLRALGCVAASVAARLANMRHGQRADYLADRDANLHLCDLPAPPPVTTAAAAQMLNVSERSVATARKVIEHGETGWGSAAALVGLLACYQRVKGGYFGG